MVKLKYILTIYDRNTKTIKHLERDASTIDETIAKELGNWGHCACTSGVNSKQHPDEFFQAGTTRDDLKCFSILCIEETIED